VSNHCAFILKVLDKDWGRKPFRSLDVWQKDNRFIVFVREKWSNYKIQGHGLFIRKEKLKKLKVVIKVWNREVFRNANQKGEEIEMKNQMLYERDDLEVLDEDGRVERKVLLAIK